MVSLFTPVPSRRTRPVGEALDSENNRNRKVINDVERPGAVRNEKSRIVLNRLLAFVQMGREGLLGKD